MYYVVHNNPHVLLQTKNNASKVYEKIHRFLQQLMFGDNIYKSNALNSLFSVQITNCLFKFDKNVAIIKQKIKEKVLDPTDFIKHA